MHAPIFSIYVASIYVELSPALVNLFLLNLIVTFGDVIFYFDQYNWRCLGW